MYRSTSPRSDRAASRDGPHMSSRFPRDQLLRSAIWPAASRRSMVVWPVAFVRVFEATDLGAAAQGPVHRVRTATGDQAWLVTGYQEVRRLLADPRLGRSHPSPASAARTGESVLFGGPLGNYDTEDADHTRMRSLLQRRSPRRRPGRDVTGLGWSWRPACGGRIHPHRAPGRRRSAALVFVLDAGRLAGPGRSSGVAAAAGLDGGLGVHRNPGLPAGVRHGR